MPRLVTIAFVACSFISLIGCGPSKKEMMMRAANRSRPKDAAEQKRGSEEAKKPAKAVVARDGENPKGPITATSVSTKKPIGQPPTETMREEASASQTGPPAEHKPIGGLRPIDDRAPESPLPEDERRRWAYENLTRIVEALKKYQQDHNGFWPARYKTNSSRMQTLSWRVELLPYLGYADLYAKFDQSKPWDMEPNKSLLPYIPKEYVSPERFDTDTNFLLPSHRTFLFGKDNKQMSPAQIEDGAENTILIAEFNDKLAVPWTSPEDYSPPDLKTLSSDLSGLREEGAFAVWANGWPFLLAKSVTRDQIKNAMTFDAGDRTRAGDIHRKIVLGQTSDAETASENDVPNVPKALAKIENAEPPVASIEIKITREEVPRDSQVKLASDRLRTLLGSKIREARRGDDKKRLAKEMLRLAREMDQDPAGAYALHNAVLTMAVNAADAGLLVDAIDQRVLRFEVDAYQINLDWINRFIDGTAKFNQDTIEGSDRLLARLISVVYAAILEDDYTQAGRLTRLASRLADRDGHERVRKLLNQMRGVLGSAKIEYDRSAKQLVTFRSDPENVIAGASIGHFLCFFKGDWSRGLPLIAAGDPSDDLRSVAATDLHGASDIDTQVAIADAWWDLSRRGRGAHRQGSQDRAVFWYLQAFEHMPNSLERMHVKNRLSEAKETDGSSPIALCNQLAEALNVDLSGGLLAIAGAKQPDRQGRGGSGRPGRSDDDDD